MIIEKSHSHGSGSFVLQCQPERGITFPMPASAIPPVSERRILCAVRSTLGKAVQKAESQEIFVSENRFFVTPAL
jgi:hypothetical protein